MAWQMLLRREVIMSTQQTAIDRLTSVIPQAYRQGITRLARGLRDRFPPVVIEHRIDTLERHIDRRLKEVEAKLDELMRRVGSKAA
jgi:hypothetical protein